MGSSGLGFRTSSFRLCWWCFLLLAAVFASTSSARNVNFVPLASEGDGRVMMEERLLRVRIADYGDATANSGHDPPATPRGKEKVRGSPKRGLDSLPGV